MNLICGINPVLEALAAGTRHFDRLLIVKGLRSRRLSDAISRASQMGIPLRFEAREALDRMAGGVPHQGVIAVVSAKPAIALEALLAAVREPALLVLLDGVEDPRNLGAVVRTAEAAGADGVIVPDRHSAGLSETVARASAGALEHVRVARVGNVVQALEAMKSRGIWAVGFDTTGTERWDAVDYRRPLVLVLGGEDRGIRRLVREHCDHLVSLPLFGHVTSLNVSVAAGIALYEAIRQRGAVPSHVRPIPARPAAARVAIVGPGPEDREQDPGASYPPPDSSDDGRAPEEDSEGAGVSGLVHIHEEAAWAGPTVLRPIGFVRRKGGRRNHPRQSPPPAAAPTGTPGVGEPEGRRRRRRRRGRSAGDRVAPPAVSPPPAGTPSPPASADGGGGERPGGAPWPARRRRRRRRRR
jgi:23S rRNA (guanosine2251-2'-O)-methyltransferase